MYKSSNKGNFYYGKKTRFSNCRPRNNQRINKIDISLFVNKAESKKFELPDKRQIASFDEFNLLDNIKKVVRQRGFSAPTPIQEKTIPVILEGKDVLGLANTGTGKTGAFLIPLLNKIFQNPSEKVLVIVPTRELAVQIEREFQLLAGRLGISSVLCIGGTNMYRQRNDLNRTFNFIIGTPGRLKDLINQRLINLLGVKTVVLDEVDRMLDMGFIHDVKFLLNSISRDRQSLFFSATTTREVTELIKDFSNNLVTFSAKTRESSTSVEQDIVRIHKPEEKTETLYSLLQQKELRKVLIFGRTKHGVQKLSTKLSSWGFRCDSIHGNKSQPQRQRALTNFRQNRINILVATDVAARGIDIADITHVINYDVPATYEDYIHRIGRTGRGNRVGKALTFIG
jgi:ATP-dependent RNA helicase RhlE